MFTAMLKTRSTRRENARAQYIETLKTKVDEFGDTSPNPVKGEIAMLRSLRDSGSLSDAAYATKVSALLGALDTRFNFQRSA